MPRANHAGKPTATPLTEHARRTAADTPGRLERLTTLFVDGQIDRAEYKRRREKLEQAGREAEQVLRASPANPQQLENLLEQIDEIADVVKQGKPEHQRAVLSTIFERHELAPY